MGKELAEVIVENGIVYRLGEHDLYYPDGRDIIGTNQKKPSKIKGLQMI